MHGDVLLAHLRGSDTTQGIPMDHLEHAKKLYRKCHDHADVISADDLAMLSVSITKLIRTCLTQQGGVTSFKYSPFIHVIKKTVGSNRFQSDRAAMAFTTLEKYLLLLVAQPWKREFWLLKVSVWGKIFSHHNVLLCLP